MGDAIYAPVNSAHILQQQVQLKIKVKGWGVGWYRVENEDGTLLFEAKTKTESWTRYLVMYDGNGQAVLVFKKSTLKTKVYSGENPKDGSSKLLFTILAPTLCQSSAKVLLPPNVDASNPDVRVSHKPLSSKWFVSYHDTLIAELTNHATYTHPQILTIYAGVDRAFISAIAIFYNEILRD